MNSAQGCARAILDRMAEELFVDVQYRGLELGRRVRIEDFAEPQAYLHHPLPMPVGTELLVDVGDGLEIPVRVARVNEQVSGNDKPAGMFVSPGAFDARAQRWWDERVANSEGPVPILKSVEEPAPSAPAAADTTAAIAPVHPEAEADASDTQVMEVVTTQEIAEAQASSEAAPEPAEAATEETAPRGKKKRRRKKRPTKG